MRMPMRNNRIPTIVCDLNSANIYFEPWLFCLADVAVEFFKPDVDCDLSDYGEEKNYQVDDEPEPELYENASHEDGKCIYM